MAVPNRSIRPRWTDSLWLLGIKVPCCFPRRTRSGKVGPRERPKPAGRIVAVVGGRSPPLIAPRRKPGVNRNHLFLSPQRSEGGSLRTQDRSLMPVPDNPFP